jgi:hypothetical protein
LYEGPSPPTQTAKTRLLQRRPAGAQRELTEKFGTEKLKTQALKAGRLVPGKLDLDFAATNFPAALVSSVSGLQFFCPKFFLSVAVVNHKNFLFRRRPVLNAARVDLLYDRATNEHAT